MPTSGFGLGTCRSPSGSPSEVLSLPMGPHLAAADAERVVEAILEFGQAGG